MPPRRASTPTGSTRVGPPRPPLYWPSLMVSRLFWRRSATAVGLYTSVVLGLLGTVAAARELGKDDFGLYATVVAAAALFESLLDLTVEESLTKFGFRYIAAEDWGRLRRLFSVAVRLKGLGALLALAALLVAAALVSGDL